MLNIRSCGGSDIINLDRFNPNQKEAILHKNGACLVLASAGSGKSTVLTNRIANLIEEHNVEPSAILAVTFTKKSAEDMQGKLRDIIGDKADSVNMGTFHSICFAMLRDEVPQMRFKEVAPSWWQTKIVKEAMLPRSNKYPYGVNLNWTPRQALGFIGYQKNNLIDYEDESKFKIPSSIDFLRGKLQGVYRQYEYAKRENNYIDFDDMLTACYSLLKNNPKIRARYQNKWEYILVDEFQDTNKAQNEILKMLGEQHQNVFVVGDDLQSIYGFRAGDVSIILNFENEWDNVKKIILETNYRSSSDIVEWSNELVKYNTQQLDKTSVAFAPKYKEPFVRHFEDAEEEAQDITIQIRHMLQNGYTENDFVVLYRTNVQSKAVEEALAKESILYQVIGSFNFYNRKEIQDMIAYLKLSQNPDNEESFERIYNKPNRYLGKAFIEKVKAYSYKNNLSLFQAMCECKELKSSWQYKNGVNFLEAFINDLASRKDMKPSVLLRYIRQEVEYDDWFLSTYDEDDANEEILEGLNSFLSTAIKFQSVQDLLDYVEDMQNSTVKENETDNREKVKLMSLHKSKGLEFPVVFLIGMNDGILPHSKSMDMLSQLEEERRLAYVGMTRAKKLLYMSWTDIYNDYTWEKSRFLQELIGEEDEYIHEDII